ncbi:MAG TPA: hypothetical protein VFC93_19735 [Chloroflexota bacterium]|nr:hypothetical protein [Chloroflexota bacterium]
MTAPLVLHVRLQEFQAVVRSHHSRVLERLAAAYPAAELRPADCPCAAAPSLDLTVGAVEHLGDVSKVVGHLEAAINGAAIAALQHRVLLHAGVVATADGAVVLPGRSGLGKSTLVAALCQAGFAYFSDDIAVLGGPPPRVFPFMKAVSLKRGGVRALGDRGGAVGAFEAIRPDGSVVRHLTPPRLAGSNGRPVRYVLLLDRRPQDAATLRPVPRARALAELAAHSMNLPRHGRHGLEILSQVVEGADCYELTYSRLPEAVEALAGVTGHRPFVGDAPTLCEPR